MLRTTDTRNTFSPTVSNFSTLRPWPPSPVSTLVASIIRSPRSKIVGVMCLPSGDRIYIGNYINKNYPCNNRIRKQKEHWAIIKKYSSSHSKVLKDGQELICIYICIYFQFQIHAKRRFTQSLGNIQGVPKKTGICGKLSLWATWLS